MSPDILDPSALISLLPTLLPANNKRLTSPQDALSTLVHSAFIALSFRLIAVDDSSSPSLMSDNVLPLEWNKYGPGNYTFKYRHDQSSLEFVIKVSKLASRTLINAIAVQSDKIASLDIPTDDFVSPSFYPHDLDSTSEQQPLIHGFISSSRLTDFISQLKLKIIQKLIPALQKDGYNEEVVVSTTSTSSNPSSSREPPPAHPRPVSPPNAPDHYPNAHESTYPPRNPLEIGRRDLDPFHTNPFAPPSLFPPHSGDGMFVGPSHPIFGNRDRNFNPNRGPWGGDGFLPPLGAPPGARFDPVGPTLPNRNPFPARGNVQDPDNDEFMPPGLRDMFT